ncbi:hypothetical protein V5799_014893 [Amblyomma americanum]|uniref:C2H2-type domain-containing protein n=1 Tax=Amblyomma americanum TaxID=6943 RepID=A0AAQ4E1Q2_AMBAM
MDSAGEPSMACHQVSEAEPVVQEEAQVIGYFDLENSGLQLVEGDNTFYLPPEALREHVLMAEEGKEGQNIIVVLGGSEDDVVQAFAENSETLLGDQATFTVNQLENAISATLPQEFAGVEAVTTTEGQQLLILSEDTSEKMVSLESAPVEESAAVLETQLLYQEDPKDNLPGECTEAGTSVQSERQPGVEKSPEVNGKEGINVLPGECTEAGTSVQSERQPGVEKSPEVNGKEGINVIPEDSRDKTGVVYPSQENSEFQKESRPVPLATSPLGVRDPSDGADSFRISISLAQCGSLGQRKIVVSPGAKRAGGTEEKQNGTVGGDIVHVKDKHSSHKSVSSAQAREAAIDVDCNSSKIPPASSAVRRRLDLANVLLPNDLTMEKGTAEFAVQKDIGSTSEGTEALDLVRAPQNTSEHVSADPPTACIPESKSDEPAQVVAEGTTAESQEAAEKGLGAQLFKRLNDRDAAKMTAKAATSTCSDEKLPVHREAALNRGTVASGTEGHEKCSFRDEDSGLGSALKQNSLEEKEAKRHTTASEDSKQQCKQFHGEHLPGVKDEKAAHVPPEKCSRTRTYVEATTEEVSLPSVTATPNSSLEGEEKPKGSVIKSAVTQKELCQTSHSVDADDFEESDGEGTPPVKEKHGENSEVDVSEEQEGKSQEVTEEVENEQNVDIANSNINMEDQQEVSQQLPVGKTPSEKPSTAAEDNTEKSLDFQTKPGRGEAQNEPPSDMKMSREVPNKQEGTVCDPATSSLAASKFEDSPTSNSHEVTQSNVSDHQEASRDIGVANALKSKVDLAEEQNATHSPISLHSDSDEKLRAETETRNIDTVCDKAASDSSDSREREIECEHSDQAPKVDSKGEYQKPNVEFQDVHREAVENPESSHCELQDRKERDNGDAIDKGSQNVRVPSPPEANDLNTKEAICAESSDEKVLAALDLVPSQEASPAPSSIAVSSPPPEKTNVAAEKPGPSSAASGSLGKKKSSIAVSSPPPGKTNVAAEKPGPSSAASGSLRKKKSRIAVSSPPPEKTNVAAEKPDVAAEKPGPSSAASGSLRKKKSRIAVSSPPPEKTNVAAEKPDVAAEKPGPSSAASGSLGKKKRKKEQKVECSLGKPGPSSHPSDAEEKKWDGQEGSSSGKKRWNLRTPTKPRKRIIIPDSDDEDFESYGSEDISAETTKSRSEEVFDVLLNVFKTEQAKKAANHAEPAVKKRAKRGGLSSSKRKPSFPKPFGSGDGAVGKEGATSTMEKYKAKEKPSGRKSHPVDTPSFVTNETPAPKRARKRRSEPAEPAEPAMPEACKKSADGDDTTETPVTGNRIPSVTDLFAGDIRIRCQKPSSSNDKAATSYHCSKCGFRSTRMENIVRHHKNDCAHSRSLFDWHTEPSKSTNSNAPT